MSGLAITLKRTETDNFQAECPALDPAPHNGIAQELPRICALLRSSCGHDFTSYRLTTLTRRLLRRMQMRHIGSAAEYASLLESDRDEAVALFKDLLIHVTAFFRDPSAFDALAQLVVPELVRKAPEGDPVRVWVPACAAGQEAYSIAILLCEEMARAQISRRVQIFATDIDEHCLRIARQGHYPATVVQEIPEERLRRFFQRRGKRYVVAPELREMCFFSPHNVITDPPFSRIDLISCRNLLIYLGVNLQRKLIGVFHYSLMPGGYLLLGPSETITEHSELFRPVDVKNRISQKKRGAGQHGSITLPLPDIQRMTFNRPEDPQGADIGAIVRPVVLAEFAPPHAVVDADFQCLYLSAQMGRFLNPVEGPFQNNLLKMVSPALRVALRAALNDARKSGQPAVRDRISRRSDQAIAPVRLTVRPLEVGADPSAAFLVAFQEEGYAWPADAAQDDGKDQAHNIIEQLERELSGTRNDLNTTIQELEAANEELKSSNEELLSMNEELHSTNEELETSKEEVQRAFDALTTAKDDLENLLASTQIATIFLDGRHRVQSFTPAVGGIYNLLGVDIGRKLTDIAHKVLAMPALPSLAEALEAAEPIEHEVQTNDGRRFLRRVLPYWTRQGEATGLVVTFVDVTELREQEGRYRQLVGLLPVAVYSCEAPSGVITFYNEHAALLWGRAPLLVDTDQRFCGSYRLWRADGSPLPHHQTPMAVALREGKSFRGEEVIIEQPGGNRVHVLVNIDPVRDSGGRVVGAINAFHDITARKQAEEAVVRHSRALATINRVNTSLAGQLDLEKLVQAVTDAGTELTGAQFGAFFYNVIDERGGKYTLYTISGVPREKFDKFPMPRNTDLFGPTFRGDGPVRMDDVTLDPRYGKNEPYFGMPKGHLPVRSYLAVPVVSRRGEVIGGLFFGHEQAGRFNEEHEKVLVGVAAQAAIAIDNARLYGESARLAAIVESTSDIVIGKDLEGRIVSWNAAAAEAYGYSAEEAIGQQISLIVPEDKREELERISDAVLKGEPIESLETQRMAKDGRRLDMLLTLSPTYSADGRLIGSSIIARDITEKKRQEQALLRATGRLTAIIGTAVDGIVTIDERGTVESANPAAERLFGYAAEEMIGKNVKMLMPDPYHGEHDAYLSNYLRTGEKKIIGTGREVLGRRKDGSIFPMELAVSETKLGERSLFTGLVRDISERARAERDRAALAAIVSSSDDAIISKNLEGIVQTWNAGAERLFGYTAEEMAGQSIRKLIPAENQAEEDEILARLARGERIEHYETVRLAKDGRRVELSLSIAPIRNAAGEIILASSIARDITERKRHAEALRESERRMRVVTDGLPVLISYLDQEHRYQFVNAAYERWFSKPQEELLGRHMREVLGEEAYRLVRPHADRALEGHFEEWEAQVTYRGLPPKYIHAVYQPHRDGAGNVVGFYALVTDVTSRRQTESQLRQSEERYRNIFQSAYVSIWEEDFSAVKEFLDCLREQGVADLRSYFQDNPAELDQAIERVRIRDVNEATLAMFEAADSSEILESLDRIFLPETRTVFIDQLEAVAEGRSLVSSESRVRTVRGRIIDVFFSVSFPFAPDDWSTALVSLMDLTDQRRAEQALRESQERLRIAVENAPLILYHCDREFRHTWFAEEPHPDFPTPLLLGRTLAEVAGKEAEPLMHAMGRVIETGKGQRIEFSLNTSLGRQTWDNTLEPLKDSTGNIVGITGCALEITERKQAEERQQLLLAELSHRVKNTLATVQSVATQTGMHTTSIAEFRKSFEARLHSLAQTHSLLTRERWKGAELRAIVLGEMGPHGGVETGRVSLNGPTIYLTPKAALSLHLVLHELATNAAKYGALSANAGSVEINWSIISQSGERWLRVLWKESGGPKVLPPGRRGFGSTIIENSVGYELDGQTRIEYLEEGLRCEFRIPWGDEIGFAA